jgi:hypothetical protein
MVEGVKNSEVGMRNAENRKRHKAQGLKRISSLALRRAPHTYYLTPSTRNLIPLELLDHHNDPNHLNDHNHLNDINDLNHLNHQKPI